MNNYLLGRGLRGALVVSGGHVEGNRGRQFSRFNNIIRIGRRVGDRARDSRDRLRNVGHSAGRARVDARDLIDVAGRGLVPLGDG